MKKSLILLLLIPALFISCGGDDEEDNNKDNSHIDNISISKDVIGVNQKVTLKVASNLVNPSFDWYDNEVIMSFNNIGNEVKWQPESKGEHNIKVVGFDDKKKEYSFTKTISVVDCDFGVAIWGDDRSIIIDSESGSLIGAENAMNLEYMITSLEYRNYTFKGGNKLSQGVETTKYPITGSSTDKLEMATLRYLTTISRLQTRYGEYISSDVNKYDLTTEVGRKQMGSIIYNNVPIETKFETDRTSILCYSKSENASSISIVIEYTKK